MVFQIRPSRDSDLAAVDALLARSYPKLLKADYPPSVLVTALPIISRARPELVGCGSYYVAEEEGRSIGVGRAILSHAIGAARAAGISELECWSTRTAEPFYAAMGFAAEGPMEVSLAPAVRFPAVRMRLRLA